MRYSIKVAAELTGLSPGTLRAWERRYGAVIPARDPSGRRSYGSDELTRLQLLHKAVDQGHTIGKLVELSDSELRDLIAESIAHATDPHPAAPTVRPPSPKGRGELCVNYALKNYFEIP